MSWPVHFVTEYTGDDKVSALEALDWFLVVVPDVHPDVNDPLGRVVICYMDFSHDIHVVAYNRVDLDSGEDCGSAKLHADTPSFRSFRMLAQWAYRYGVAHPEIAGLRQ